MKTIYWRIALIFVSVTALFLYLFRSDIRVAVVEIEKLSLPPEIPHQSTAQPVSPPVDTAVPGSTAVGNLSAGINLAVPFSAQAPFGDWGAPYGEACEEASAILVAYYFNGQTVTPESMRGEILNVVSWENKNLGYYEQTNVEDTARILREYFGFKRVDIEYDITMPDIKTHLMAGRPVIVPLAGRLVGNPFYRQPGPVYHMLVVKGITKNGDFITNDVGTRHGQNYVYGAQTLFDAIHDAPMSGDGEQIADTIDRVLSERRAIIVAYPNQI